MNVVADYITGRRISFEECEKVLDGIRRQWRGTLQINPDGTAGWYRRLGEYKRIGVVASAQSLLGLLNISRGLPDLPNVVSTLVSRQNGDGGWTFVSTLDQVSVVDATAWAIMALTEIQHEHQISSLDIPAVVAQGSSWLEHAERNDGGWGVCLDAPFRAYSTALALQALATSGRASHQVVLRGAKALVSAADQATGAWYDAGRRLSVPTTARAILALLTITNGPGEFDATVDRAMNWLISIGGSTDYWTEGSKSGVHEEVEVVNNDHRVRVEYWHCPRQLALQALIEGGKGKTPLVAAGIRKLLDNVEEGVWNAAMFKVTNKPTSWMLYDTCATLLAFKKAFPDDIVSIWADNSRIVTHPYGRRRVIGFLFEQSRKLYVVVFVVSIVVVLHLLGIIKDISIVSIVAFLAMITINVVSNLISSYILNHPN